MQSEFDLQGSVGLARERRFDQADHLRDHHVVVGAVKYADLAKLSSRQIGNLVEQAREDVAVARLDLRTLRWSVGPGTFAGTGSRSAGALCRSFEWGRIVAAGDERPWH
jgi:hypothetical protein